MINIDEIISEANSIAIGGHVRPDGDCVGSTLGMYNYIVDNYPSKKVVINLETVPNTFHFLKNADKIGLVDNIDTSEVYDLFMCFDCGESSRLGQFNEALFNNAKKTVCIDHHIKKGNFADFEYIIQDESSTCELVYNVLPKDKITKEIAECLYTGIIHDTGVFQYNCTTKATMECAGFLMEKGIDFSTICNDTYFAKTNAQNRVMGKALLDSKLYCNGKIIATVTDASDMAMFNVLPRHLDGIVQQLRLTTGVDVAIYLYETGEGDFKCSTRASSHCDFDLAAFCATYGGGGHKKAAGFNVATTTPWDEIEKMVKVIEERL